MGLAPTTASWHNGRAAYNGARFDFDTSWEPGGAGGQPANGWPISVRVFNTGTGEEELSVELGVNDDWTWRQVPKEGTCENPSSIQRDTAQGQHGRALLGAALEMRGTGDIVDIPGSRI